MPDTPPAESGVPTSAPTVINHPSHETVRLAFAHLSELQATVSLLSEGLDDLREQNEELRNRIHDIEQGQGIDFGA